ncbi:MAG: MFS transporter [Bacteroidetes bacterium]|nr:MFS transporter [Bacteroidota bacterium]
MKVLNRTIVILSFVSLGTDMASEMLYPVMPVYLRHIGFSVFFIGILEGIAEATAGLSKGYFGNLSDLWGKRLPFVKLGYFLSAVTKPLMVLFQQASWVLGVRTLDRLGKGMRTAPRDAMLSDASAAGKKATVFGFHRAMDTIGAILGPVSALIWLWFFPGDYLWLFLLAFIPGIISVGLLWTLKEVPRVKSVKRASFFSFVSFFRNSNPEFKRVAGTLLFFAIFNSSDVFLLLKMKDAGFADHVVIGFYIFYNLIYALAAYPLGKMADRISPKRLIMAGLFFFILAYAGLGVFSSFPAIAACMLAYGLFAACTEGQVKAWLSEVCDKGKTATALGSFLSFQSICLLIASWVTGLLWWKFGATVALLYGAVGALLTALVLIRRKVS